MTDHLTKTLHLHPQQFVVMDGHGEDHHLAMVATLPMVREWTEQGNTGLPNRYRVMGWGLDGRVWVWEVTHLALGHSPDSHASHHNPREAQAMEVDEYFPYLLKRVADFCASQAQEYGKFVDWVLPQLAQWGVVQLRASEPTGSPN